MRQRRWLIFFKDCDFELNYHLGKSNIVVDALSRNSLHILKLMVREMDLIDSLEIQAYCVR